MNTLKRMAGLSTLGIILLIVILLIFFGGFPMWGLHNHGWAPTGIGGFLLFLFIILLVLGRI